MPKSCKRSHQYEPPGDCQQRVCRLCAHVQLRAGIDLGQWQDASDCPCPTCEEALRATLTEDPRRLARNPAP